MAEYGQQLNMGQGTDAHCQISVVARECPTGLKGVEPLMICFVRNLVCTKEQC